MYRLIFQLMINYYFNLVFKKMQQTFETFVHKVFMNRLVLRGVFLWFFCFFNRDCQSCKCGLEQSQTVRAWNLSNTGQKIWCSLWGLKGACHQRTSPRLGVIFDTISVKAR